MKDYSYIDETTPVKGLPSVWPIDHEIDSVLPQVLPYHPHLKKEVIIFLFKKSMKYGGTAQVCNKQLKAILDIYDADADFIICLNWQVWKQLTDAQKEALVDHELEHCKYDENDRPIMKEHDLEEFTCVVERHGLWTTALQHMEKTMRRRRPVNLAVSKRTLTSVE